MLPSLHARVQCQCAAAFIAQRRFLLIWECLMEATWWPASRLCPDAVLYKTTLALGWSCLHLVLERR